MPNPANLTEQQRKWFASVRDGLERETGKTLAEWTDLARGCPETAHRKRLAWMKAQYGLGQNRASMVLNAAFPSAQSWAEPEILAAALWTDPAARAIHDAVHAAAVALPDVIVGQRKAFTAFSRGCQFAAVKPVRAGVLLGLAIPVEDGLVPTGRNGWSERLSSQLVLADAAAVTARVESWVKSAWERSK